MSSKPNILLIGTDDLINIVRFRDAFGVELITPNIDRLIGSSALFSNAYATTPLCNPSRTALFTGKSSFRTGIFSNLDPSGLEAVPLEENLVSRFRDNGYYAVGIGKSVDTTSSPLLHQLFDHYQEVEGWWNSDNELDDPKSVVGLPPVTSERMADTNVATWSRNFLKSYQKQQPFFLSLGFRAPHLPWKVPQEFYDLYEPSNIIDPYSRAGQTSQPTAFFKQFLTRSERVHTAIQADQSWRSLIHGYMAAVSYVDSLVGLVLDGLDNSLYGDNTVVVLWSDHGYHLGDHDHWGKFTLWEAGNNIPLVIRDPRLKASAGTQITTPTSLLDIFPTLLGLSDLPPLYGLQGRDLSGLLKRTETSLRRPGVISHVNGSVSLRTEHYRLTVYNNGELELYDCRNDPFNLSNLSQDPLQVNTLQDLMRRLKISALDLGMYICEPGQTVLGGSEDEVFILPSKAAGMGRLGDDTYHIISDSKPVELLDQGYDKIMLTATGDFNIPDHIEELIVTKGGKDLAFRGNDRDNRILLNNYYGAKVWGQGGNDYLQGASSRSYLYGDDGNDILIGKNSKDDLFGGDGDDILIGGGGPDQLWGNGGNDRFTLEDYKDSNLEKYDRIEDFGEGNDVIDIPGDRPFSLSTLNPYPSGFLKNLTRVGISRIMETLPSYGAGTITLEGSTDTIVVINGETAGFQPGEDAIIRLKNFGISESRSITFI